ncbi:hypothetical protein HZH68_010643 [Vespula germanica]|uniref:Uncharacterized protein n=1 Tax=Vespula germanica TaxID=30212 RepID=A0A834JVQ4_VESGE|nr:hypothetical protein HZH68_010643 [Vespula germanica]
MLAARRHLEIRDDFRPTFFEGWKAKGTKKKERRSGEMEIKDKSDPIEIAPDNAPRREEEVGRNVRTGGARTDKLCAMFRKRARTEGPDRPRPVHPSLRGS